MRSPYFLNRPAIALAFSGNTSPTAWTRTALSASRIFPRAPVPRPPQPISPTLIASFPAAWTAVGIRLAAAAVAVATAPAFRKSRRLAFGVMEEAPSEWGKGWVGSVHLLLDHRLDPDQLRVLLDRQGHPEPDHVHLGQPPDALRQLRVVLHPALVGPAASGRPQPVRLVRPRPAADRVRPLAGGRLVHRPDGHRVGGELGVKLRVVVVQAPLPDVAVHVAQPEPVRLFGPDLVGGRLAVVLPQ